MMKNKTTTALLAFFLGGFGIHRFYLGQTFFGILYLIFFWTFIPFFIAFIDFIVIITSSDDKFNFKYNSQYQNDKTDLFCEGCNTKLTFMTTPNLGGGKLNDGGKVCRECFKKMAKIDSGFGLNSSKKYSAIDVKGLLNNPFSETSVNTSDIFSVSTKSKGKNQNEITFELDAEKLIPYVKQQQEKRDFEIRNFPYNHSQIQRQGVQLLESLNILNTTKNLDTLKGRFEFIHKMYDDFIKASHNKRYITDIQIAIDQYKTMYYDKILKDFELQLLVKPEHEKLIDYYSLCLFNSFNSFANEQEQQIDLLKKEDAKNKRKEKILEIGNETIFEFDANGSEKEEFKSHLSLLKERLEKYKRSSSLSISIPTKSNLVVKNPIVINPKSSFELTLYNSDQATIKKVVTILKDENLWNKTADLLPYFASENIKCKEVDEYIEKYKPIYISKLSEQCNKSEEYRNASEMDKTEIEKEFKNEVLNQLYEKADCELDILFEYSNIDITIDDKIVEKYSFNVISKYFGLGYYKNKVVTHWERKDFEDLLKADLVYTFEQIDKEEMLTSQTLKTLNAICEKDENHFKRKNKAIEYLKENNRLYENIGKHIATRNIFKLKPLPAEFKNIDIEEITNYWSFLKEYIKLISDTFRNSENNHEDLSHDNSWIKGFTVQKAEDYNTSQICQRAREECKKKYSKSNPPKMPFHIGCNCDLRTDT